MPTIRLHVSQLIIALALVLASATAQTFNCTGSSTTFTAPTTGVYHIVVNGAKGGDSPPTLGGAGAQVAGDFSLSANQTLTIAVGCAGGSGLNTGGGGGGTFVVACRD